MRLCTAPWRVPCSPSAVWDSRPRKEDNRVRGMASVAPLLRHDPTVMGRNGERLCQQLRGLAEGGGMNAPVVHSLNLS